MAIELDVCGLLTDALENMKRYWLNREHFAYTVEYHAGATPQEAAESVRCGITILRTTGPNRWVMTLEIPTTEQKREVGDAEDIDGVWKWFESLRQKYCN